MVIFRVIFRFSGCFKPPKNNLKRFLGHEISYESFEPLFCRSENIPQNSRHLCKNQRNPRTHKNKIGTSPPLLTKQSACPPKARNFMGMEVYLQKECRNSRRPQTWYSPFRKASLALDLRAEKLRTLGFLRANIKKNSPTRGSIYRERKRESI